MYNIKFGSYVPEPKPATADRIVAAHYYGAWKYGSAGLHEGFNDLAKEFPDRTPLMGYYDEENPEVCDWEIKWATEHGVNCFIYCWYRYPENMGKKVELESLRCSHAIHEAFFNARYRNFMKFAIMFEASPRWCGTDENDMTENLMPFWLENYFTKENYLVMDNKPVLFVYQQERLESECFKSAESQRQTFEKCSEIAKKYGFDGMIFAACNTSLDKKDHDNLISRGYDFRFGYNSGYVAPYPGYDDEKDIIKQQCNLFSQRLEIDRTTFIPTASCFNDPTPRFSKRWLDQGYDYRKSEMAKIWYLEPENFKELLKEMKKITDALPENAWARKIIMLDNWNEWDEGHFIAPSHKFGYKYLQAVREALTACDNLPDYVTPADQGFGPYNKSYVTPDFGEFCRKKLEENT